jgi:competence protein ComEC
MADTAGPSPADLEPLWRAPLVPVALAATAGILLDRWLTPPFMVWMVPVLLLVPACAFLSWHNRALPALLLLGCAVGFLAGGYHHWRRDIWPADDIGNLATVDPRPILLRGAVDTEPLVIKRDVNNDLRSFPAPDAGRFVLQVASVKQLDDWAPASGRVMVQIGRPPANLHVGDEIELAGRMASPAPPANPGEFDYASALLDQGIRATLSVKDDPSEPDDGSALVLKRGSEWSFDRLLARMRGFGQRTLTEYLPPERQGVAIALLLGEGAPMTQDDWEKYARTGVIHVLAISGQHLVVLAAFLGFFLRLAGVRLRTIAVTTTLILLFYALLVGGRPPVMRSVAAVGAICGGVLLRRPVLRANTFAFAWLVVIALNPTDLVTAGCQLSFLSVAVLAWGTRGWSSETDPLEKLVHQTRPTWHRALLWLGREVAWSYAITLAIWIVVAPLVAARQNLVSPAGLLIGPPTVVLTSIALLSGFALLFFSTIAPPFAWLAAFPTQWSLAGCDELVAWAAQWPGAFWYTPSPPAWWLGLYYPAVFAFLMFPLFRRLWRGYLAAMVMLVAVGLAGGATDSASREFRCTFLAVGHGGCAVMETPDGRVLLYDAGSLAGPEVARRQIAPYLWHRGFTRIDEVFLSHADLDHFNGLALLLERFPVGQITCTPTFQLRETPAARRTLRELAKYGIPIRIVSAGQRLKAGPVEIEVLHPPAAGPEGNENSRSLVLVVRHEGNAILLTGDLEGAGLERVLTLPPVAVDVLMAPHHGNRAATVPLIPWATPKVLVSCEGAPRGRGKPPGDERQTVPWFGTWPHGAITFHSREGSLIMETFCSQVRRRL